MINTQIVLSKNAERRIHFTNKIRYASEKCLDGKNRLVKRARFDIGRYLDRSKYKP